MIYADVLVIAAPLYFRAPPAKFHLFTERLVSIFFYKECRGEAQYNSPLQDKPCALIGVAEYSNPAVLLEYLSDFCNVLKMRPLTLKHFPYLGIGGQGHSLESIIFSPLERCIEMAGLISELHKPGDCLG